MDILAQPWFSIANLGIGNRFEPISLETILICILLLASRDVHFDKSMICFLSDLL